jgi:hypothetical protein
MTHDDDQILYLRSDEELESQNKGLRELKKILEDASVPYFLSSGTLLGAVREGNFIRWDWDVQFYLTTETSFPYKDLLLDRFKRTGFQIKSHDASYENLKFALTKYGTIYELTAWFPNGAMRSRRDWQVPARFFENVEIMEFLGESYPCMTPAEEYLEFCYGDWRTPRRTRNKDAYVNSIHFRLPRWRRRMKKLKQHTIGWMVWALRPIFHRIRRSI